MTTMAISQGDIWTRVFRPDVADMSVDAARSILKLDFSPEDRRRMDVLAEKARLGELSEAETEELRNYEHVDTLLSIMQSKARRCMKDTGNGQ